MDYSLGLDVGSVNVKLALVDESCKIVQLDVEKITSGPKVAVASLISRLSEKFNLEEITTAGVSGSGRAVIPRELNWKGRIHYVARPVTIGGLVDRIEAAID